MAYDPANGGQLVLFGGGYGATDYNDTWTWNGATWAQLLPAASPSARYALTMAYDVATNQMVLFGGINTSATYYNDTWIMGAPSVTSLSTVSGPTTGYIPLTITGSGFAGLAASGAVMFGTTAAASYTVWSSTSITTSSPPEAAGTVDVTVTGSAGTSPKTGADQFTYSNTTWYQASPPTVPTARDGAAQAYDPATGQMIMFGGSESGTYVNETWTWTGATWPSFSRLPAQRSAVLHRWPTTAPPASCSSLAASTAAATLPTPGRGPGLIGPRWPPRGRRLAPLP